MMKTLGIVELNLEAAGSANALTRRLAGKPLIDWVVRRATESQQLDGVIVIVGKGTDVAQVAELVPPDVPVFAGSQEDVLSRYCEALDEYQAENVVRIRADNPFVDPVLIDQLVTRADACSPIDYVSYCSSDGRPAILSPLGVFAEWITVDSLRRANQIAKNAADRQDATRFVYSHPEEFSLRLIPIPTSVELTDVRLQVDSDEDWENTEAIYEALGPERLDWQGITGFLKHQPGLRQRMAALNRDEVEA